MPRTHKREERSYAVRWLVSPTHRLELSASFVAGLSSMARSGAVSLTLEPHRNPDSLEGIVRWDVREIGRDIQRKIALDEFDRNDVFDLATLGEVDLYFKRSYSPRALLSLPEESRSKIRPSGVVFGCLTSGSWRLSARAALTSSAAELGTQGLGGLGPTIRRVVQNADHIQGYLNVSAYERLPSDPLLEQVVFQSRIWPEEPDPLIDRRAANAERIAIVRALRAEFGRDDLVGLIHSDLAAKTAPDAQLGRRVSRKEYARQLRTSLIAVISHGLDGSGGYKIGESLAAGCALVIQPFLFELPEPMLPEVNYLPFQTPEECVTQCTRLLADRPLAERMRAANQKYYRDFVQPVAFVRRLLARAFTAA